LADHEFIWTWPPSRFFQMLRGAWHIILLIDLWCLTFNNISAISWWTALLVEETGLPGEKHRSVPSHWQTLSYSVVSIEYTSPWTGFGLTALVVIYTYYTDSCKSNDNTITSTTFSDVLKQLISCRLPLTFTFSINAFLILIKNYVWLIYNHYWFERYLNNNICFLFC
jgi:hypothetical protein